MFLQFLYLVYFLLFQNTNYETLSIVIFLNVITKLTSKEQKVMSNKQKLTSNEQRAKCSASWFCHL